MKRAAPLPPASAALLSCAAAHAATRAPPPGHGATPHRLAENADVNRSVPSLHPAHRIEDRIAKVEELRVRGQLQKVTVDLKGRAPSYEILTHDGARDIADGGLNGLGGSAGKRVWNVLRF